MNRQRPVWGYFALGLLGLGIGIVALKASLGDMFPLESTLRKFSGEIATVRIVEGFSGQSIGLNTPLNAIHFTLEDDKTIYRFPSGWPGYSDLYERLAFTVDVWVDPDDLASAEPVIIYALKQTTPPSWPYPAISVSYQEVVDSQDNAKRSYRTLSTVLLGVSPILFLIGYVVVVRNRRRGGTPKLD